MTQNWSFAKIIDILLKNLGQWSYIKITISIPLISFHGIGKNSWYEHGLMV